jgi:hypothetical protein
MAIDNKIGNKNNGGMPEGYQMPSNNQRNNELGFYTNIWDSTLNPTLQKAYSP